jgi:carbamoyl-phosphate synthase large subunit
VAADDRPTVIVTGVGAIIGYGIIRGLRASRFSPRVVGIDIFADAVGRAWCDEFVQGVRADSPAFGDFIIDLAERTHAALIIPGIEQDMRALDTLREHFVGSSCTLALNSSHCISLFGDKAETTRFLRAHGLPSIPTILPRSERLDLEQALSLVDLPCLLKPAVSYARKGQRVLSTRDELARALAADEDVLIQRYVGRGAGVEHTVAIFGLGDGRYVNAIQLERTLGPDGATAKARTAHDSAVLDQIDALSALAKPLGPTNFQFIREPGGPPQLLEVNPRISSSTSIRQSFGVNEAEMCLEWFVAGQAPAPRVVRAGNAQRFIDEIVTYDDRDHQ